MGGYPNLQILKIELSQSPNIEDWAIPISQYWRLSIQKQGKTKVKRCQLGKDQEYWAILRTLRKVVMYEMSKPSMGPKFPESCLLKFRLLKPNGNDFASGGEEACYTKCTSSVVEAEI